MDYKKFPSVCVRLTLCVRATCIVLLLSVTHDSGLVLTLTIVYHILLFLNIFWFM